MYSVEFVVFCQMIFFEFGNNIIAIQNTIY